MSEQPYLFSEGPWIPIRDGNDTALSLFLRHYSARGNRKIRQFIGPGEKLVLLSRDARALFAWRKFQSDNGQLGVNCAIFRNEASDAGRSSDLIRAAALIAWQRWPGERLYTYVDAAKVRHKRDPGRCFLRAGWRYCGRTKKRNKLILENVEGLVSRCDREIKEIRETIHEGRAFLVPLGLMDWTIERDVILGRRVVRVGSAVHELGLSTPRSGPPCQSTVGATPSARR